MNAGKRWIIAWIAAGVMALVTTAFAEKDKDFPKDEKSGGGKAADKKWDPRKGGKDYDRKDGGDRGKPNPWNKEYQQSRKRYRNDDVSIPPVPIPPIVVPRVPPLIGPRIPAIPIPPLWPPGPKAVLELLGLDPGGDSHGKRGHYDSRGKGRGREGKGKGSKDGKGGWDGKKDK